MLKLQDQLKRSMGSGASGAGYTGYGLELNGQVAGSAVEGQDKDLKALLKNGYQKELAYLREENRILKQNLLTF